MPRHTDRDYEQELETLRERILFMGAQVERLVDLPASRSHQAAWTRASQKLRDHLLASIDRTTLYRLMDKHNFQRSDESGGAE